MNVPAVTHVWTVAPASTEWISLRASVNRNSLGPSVKQVSVYEMMAGIISEQSSSCTHRSQYNFLQEYLQPLGIGASLTQSLPPLVHSC